MSKSKIPNGGPILGVTIQEIAGALQELLEKIEIGASKESIAELAEMIHLFASDLNPSIVKVSASELGREGKYSLDSPSVQYRELDRSEMTLQQRELTDLIEAVCRTVEHFTSNPPLNAPRPTSDQIRKIVAALKRYGGAPEAKGEGKENNKVETDFLSVQEVADVCQKSNSRISQLCKEGEIESRGEGRKRTVSLIRARAYFAEIARKKTSASNATIARDARKDAREIEREATKYH